MAILTAYWTLDVFIVFLAFLVAVFLYLTRNNNYWEKRGVLAKKPIPIFGNFADCCLFRTTVAEYLKLLYDQGKGLPYVGFYLFDKPVLVLRDTDIIKDVLLKDFNHFENRYASARESDILGSSNLFLLKNPLWRFMRRKLTPAFTSGKIKMMFPLLDAIGGDLVNHFKSLDLGGNGRAIELKDIAAKYTTDVIGSCAFGLQANSLNDPNAEFRKHGKEIFDVSFLRGFELMSIFFIPGLVKPLGIKAFKSSGIFLRKVFWDTFNQRLKSGVKRHDLIDILIELRDSPVDKDDPHAFKIDGDYLVGQAAVFFAAGFETSSTLICFTLHELSLHPDIQAKVRDEINTTLEQNGGQLTYDLVQQLKYLDKVTWETLRKYPSVPFLDRETVKDYTIPKTGLVIEKGTPVYIPLFGLHNDPEYFPDPEKFDPERFNEENKQNHRSHVYMPFGEGPRACIGMRFGLLQAKVGLIKILSNYELTPCEKTLIPMKLDPKGVFPAAKGGLYHQVRKIQATVG